MEQADYDKAITDLIAAVEENAKPILNAYKRSVLHDTNIKNLSKFDLEALENCAQALKIPIFSEEDVLIKLYPTNARISERIILKLESHLPSKCNECDSAYTIPFNSNEEEWLQCFLCSQKAHNCEKLRQKVLLYRSLSSTLNGAVWLCHGCHEKNDCFKKQITGLNDKKSPYRPLAPPQDGENQLQQRPNAINKDKRHGFHNHDPNNYHNKTVICKEYRLGKCAKGVNCNFYHPDKCLNYCRFGREGCNEGYKCNRLHPVLCKSSLYHKECYLDNCTLAHLKGTKRKKFTSQLNPRVQYKDPQLWYQGNETPKPNAPYRGSHQSRYDGRDQVVPPRGNAAYHYNIEDFPALPHQNNYHSNNYHPSVQLDNRKRPGVTESNKSNDTNFLELKNMLVNMQSQINIINSRLPHPTQFQKPRQENRNPSCQLHQ